MFAAPVTVSEVGQVINSLKSNSSAGFDEIPMSLVKQCLCYFKKPLVHIYNVSFQTGIFPDMMKKTKIRPFLRKDTEKTYRIIDRYPSFQRFLKS